MENLLNHFNQLKALKYNNSFLKISIKLKLSFVNSILYSIQKIEHKINLHLLLQRKKKK